jgi:putative ABC transport system permease protein
MSIQELFATAFRSLFSNKLRTFLTVLGIIIGITAVITLLNIGESAQKSITGTINSLGSNLITIIPGRVNNNSPLGLDLSSEFTLDDVNALRDNDALYYSNIAAVSSRDFPVQFGSNTKAYTLSGTYGDYFEIRSFDVASGRAFSDEESKNLSRVAVIGPDVAQYLFGNSKAIGEKIRVNGTQFTVIGVTKAKGSSGFNNPDEIIHIPMGTYQKVLTGDDSVRIIYAQSKTADVTEYAQKEIALKLRQARGIRQGEEQDFTIRNSQEFLETLNQITGIFTIFLSAIGGISLVVGGIGIMNIMFVTVRERTREIGLRKALGATNRDILLQFLTEAVVVTLLGGLIGTVLGVALTLVISQFADLEPVISINSIVLAVGISAGIGLIFGIYPARQASLMSPIEALRFE